MVFLSDFADQAVVLPLALIVTLVLGVMGWWRGLFAWVGSVGATLAVILALKLLGLALADDLRWGEPLSPSGHTASACVVYGGLAVLMLRGVLPAPLLAAITPLILLAMGYTRVELLAHNPMEVLIGGVVGCIGVAILAATAGPRPRLVGWPVLGAAACTMLVFHGMHLPAETAIRSVFAAPP
jgi:membrane-associated phospholipid phosphatase